MANRTYPSYLVYRDSRQEYRWEYAASNGEVIAVSSEGYKRRADCEHGIALMKSSHSATIWYTPDAAAA